MSTLVTLPVNFLSSVYEGISYSYNLITFIALYAVVSDVLFERILVNRIILPLCMPFIWSQNRTTYDVPRIERVTFWFNDWLYESRSEDMILREPILSKEERYIPFFKWKKFDNKYVRFEFSRSQISYKSRLKRILLTCLFTNTILISIIAPLEIGGFTFPLRLFVLLGSWVGPKIIWDRYLSDIVNTKFILNEFRTPRITIIFITFFYLIPTLLLFGGEISLFFLDTLIPSMTQTRSNWFNKISKFLLKQGYRKALFLDKLYQVWYEYGNVYLIILGISAILDNWWDANVLPRFEQPGKTDLEKFSTSLLDCYRVRNTDRFLALWPFMIVAIEVFGRPYLKIWSPVFYSFIRELDYVETMYYYPQHIIEVGEWDGLLIRNHIWTNHVFMGFLHLVFENLQWIIRPIAGLLKEMNLLFKSWPGFVPFMLSMLWRGLRFRGPDTYPNWGDDIPGMPTRTPFIRINRKVTKSDKSLKRATRREKLGKLADEDKLVQIVPKCKWQKFFVRWNWCYALTLEFLHAIVYGTIFKTLVGTANYKLITLNASTMLAIKHLVVNTEALVWCYGIICCLYGCCAKIPLFQGACQFHCGVFVEIEDRFELDEKIPLVLYPYDVIEMKRVLNAINPSRYIPRKQKIRLFIKVQLEKLKENLPKLFGVGVILTYLTISAYEHVNINYPLYIYDLDSKILHTYDEPPKIWSGGSFEPTELSIDGTPIVMSSEDDKL